MGDGAAAVDVAASLPSAAPAVPAPSAPEVLPARVEGERAPRNAEQRERDAAAARARRAAKKAKQLAKTPPQKDEVAPQDVEKAPQVWPSLDDCKKGVEGVAEAVKALREVLATAGLRVGPSPLDAAPPLLLGPLAAKLATSGDLNASPLMTRILTPELLAVAGVAALVWPYIAPMLATPAPAQEQGPTA